MTTFVDGVGVTGIVVMATETSCVDCGWAPLVCVVGNTVMIRVIDGLLVIAAKETVVVVVVHRLSCAICMTSDEPVVVVIVPNVPACKAVRANSVVDGLFGISVLFTEPSLSLIGDNISVPNGCLSSIFVG